MSYTSRVFPFTVALTLLASAASAQVPEVYDVSCAKRLTFSGCERSQLKLNRADRIGLVAKVVSVTPGEYCRKEVSVDVLQASAGTSERLKITLDCCTDWSAQPGHVVNVAVWERANPRTGARDLARCVN